MNRTTKFHLTLLVLLAFVGSGSLASAQGEAEDGFTSLFNGSDLSGWVVPEGDGGHWKVVDGVIDYDLAQRRQG